MPDDIFTDIIKPKVQRKKVTFAIDEDVLTEFSKLAKAKKYNKSLLVENLLKLFMAQEKK